MKNTIFDNTTLDWRMGLVIPSPMPIHGINEGTRKTFKKY